MTERAAAIIENSNVENLRFEQGAELGKYTILGGIEETKGAEIYCGEHVDNGELVAVKAMKSVEVVDDLRHEIQLHGRVAHHPNVVRIADFDLLGPTLYLSTPLQEQGTLADVIRQYETAEKTGIDQVLGLVQQSADELPTNGEYMLPDFEVNEVKVLPNVQALSAEFCKTITQGSVSEMRMVLKLVAETISSSGYFADEDSLEVKHVAIDLLRKSAGEHVALPPSKDRLTEIYGLQQGMVAGILATHAAGVVIRDIKLQNILVGADGVARLADYGIATTKSQCDPKRVPGTVTTIAPEAYRGIVGPSLDTFAANRVMYRMLTGREAWPIKSTPEATLAVMQDHEPQNILEINSEVDEELAMLCMNGLALVPQDRSSLKKSHSRLQKLVA